MGRQICSYYYSLGTETTKSTRKKKMEGIASYYVNVSDTVTSPPDINLLKSNNNPWPQTTPTRLTTPLCPPPPPVDCYLNMINPPPPTPSLDTSRTISPGDWIFITSHYPPTTVPPFPPLPILPWSILHPLVLHLKFPFQHQAPPTPPSWDTRKLLRAFEFSSSLIFLMR